MSIVMLQHDPGPSDAVADTSGGADVWSCRIVLAVVGCPCRQAQTNSLLHQGQRYQNDFKKAASFSLPLLIRNCS